MNPDWPSTLTEAVDRLMSTMRVEDLATLRDTPEGNLIQYHFSLGVHIRNEFGLWQGNDELLRSCCAEIDDPWLREIATNNPDKASGVIIEALWQRLQSQA